MGTARRSRFRSRALRAVATLAVAGGVFAGLQVASAATAAAVGTVQVIAGQVSVSNSLSPKFAPERVVLSEMRPAPSTTGGRDTFEAGAFELSPGTNANWSLQAFAVCAPPIAGLHLVVGRSISSNSLQRALVDCGSNNEAIYGVGSRILGANGQATLIGETSETSHQALAQAREDVDGFSGIWELDVFAVCGPFPVNYGTSFGLSSLNPTSDPVQVAFSRCGSGKLLGMGAEIVNAIPGTGLQVVFPGSPIESSGVEATPTNATWGPTTVQGICGD